MMKHQAVKFLEDNSTTLLSTVDDESPLYSGLAEILYERFADGEFLEYTPLPEVSISSKFVNIVENPDISPFMPWLSAYPNPTSDFINIELASNVLDDDIIEFLKHYGFENIDDCATIEVNIYDINSRLVSTGKYNYDTPVSICVRDYTSGTYLVEIKGCYDNVMQTKIVKL